MKLNIIINSINEYFSKKFPVNKGWFIATESTVSTSVKAYKEFKIDLYYHLPKKNSLVFTFKRADRCLSGEEETFKEKMYAEYITALLENRDKIDNYGIQ